MNPILSEALTAVKTVVDSALTQASADVPKLSDEGLQFLETTVAPKLDVPVYIVTILKGENATIEAPVDSFAQAELALLKARVDALI